MKKYCVLFVIGLSLSLRATAQSAEEKEVMAAVENLRVAMVDGNKSALENLAAENLSYGHSSGKVENKAEFVEAIASGKSDFVKIDVSDQVIKITDRTAVVRHNLKGETNNAGTPGTLNIHVLTVWVKQKTQWKMIARQAIKLP